MSNIILFATYWNEMEWIHASLAQIDRIEPKEAIICDGCFDSAHPNQSTDGTRDVIEKYVSGRDNARMISACRFSRLRHCLEWLRPLPHERNSLLPLARLRYLPFLAGFNLYRLNQMATFNRMIRLSRHFQVHSWFMTYDCDLFYADDMIEQFRRLDSNTTCDLLTSHEYTFFKDFENYTDQYEQRDYNNMPHRASGDTRFIPTRHPAGIVDGSYRICTSFKKKHHAGVVYHYHIKSQKRMVDGYSLGDRRPPAESRTMTCPFNGQHPQIIKEMLP